MASSLSLVSFLMGFFVCLLIVFIAAYIVRKDIRKKKLELEKNMGVSMDALTSALSGVSADKVSGV